MEDASVGPDHSLWCRACGISCNFPKAGLSAWEQETEDEGWAERRQDGNKVVEAADTKEIKNKSKSDGSRKWTEGKNGGMCETQISHCKNYFADCS